MKHRCNTEIRVCLLAGALALTGCGDAGEQTGEASKKIQDQAEDAADEVQKETEKSAGD